MSFFLRVYLVYDKFRLVSTWLPRFSSKYSNIRFMILTRGITRAQASFEFYALKYSSRAYIV